MKLHSAVSNMFILKKDSSLILEFRHFSISKTIQKMPSILLQIQCIIIYYTRGQVVRYQSASDQFKWKLSGKIEHVAADPW
jgi:hypothetical protein